MSWTPDLTPLKDVLSYSRLLVQGNHIEQDIGGEDIYPRPILLIHGFLGTRAVMLPIERYLNKHEDINVFSIALGVVNTDDIRYSAFRIHRAVERICYDLDIEHVDIIAHSMGGLIGLYYIKKLGGHERVRKLITLGTPYTGTTWAYAGVAAFGVLSRAIWQMTPDSFFLKELHTGKIPDDVEVYAIEAKHDVLVPPCAAEVEGIRAVSVEYGHTSLIFSPEVYGKIHEILTL